jgi:hypothetical protein
MNVPCLPWLQDPWSPAGYDVVELPDEAAPADPGSDSSDAPTVPRSPVGYRVVELSPPPNPQSPECPPEVDLVVEEVLFAADCDAEVGAERDTKPARPVKRRRPRQRRRRLIWAVLAVCAYCMAALALVLVLVRLPAQARSVGTAEVRPQQDKPLAAAEADWKPDRLTFGTNIQFVRNPSEAGRIADKQHKLTCLLHVSGNFEDAGFT